MRPNTAVPPVSTGVPKQIVVVGGGVTGAISAFELQRAGHQVTLLEANSWGSGSSSRSAACIRAQFGTPSTVKGMIYCTQYYRLWAEIVGGTQSPISQNGYLFLKDWNADMEAVRRTVAMQREAGLGAVQILNRVELDRIFPYLETTGVQGATWCPTDGFLEPGMVYSGAVAAAVELGAKVFQNREVCGVKFEGGKPIAVKTTSGEVFTGDLFVNCAGAWAPNISHMFRGFPLDIKARRRYLYFLEGFGPEGGEYLSAEDFQDLPMLITPRGAYCRPESAQGGGLMMGWLHPTRPVRPEFGNQDDVELRFATGGDNVYGESMRKELTAYLPDVAKMGNFRPTHAGFYEDSPDHNPFIGFDPWVPQLIHAAGFSGHGLMHAPFSARIVAELASSTASGLDTIRLPFTTGEVDIKPYEVDRKFANGEGMVI